MSEKQREENQNQHLEQNGIIYSINEKEETVIVIGCNSRNEKIIIPSCVNHESKKYDVTSIKSVEKIGDSSIFSFYQVNQ